MTKQLLTGVKILWAGSTLDKLQVIPLDQIQIRHRLNPMKMTKVYILLTEKTENRVITVANLGQKINRIHGSNRDAIDTIL